MKGGCSSSILSITWRSRRMFLPFTLSFPVVKTSSSFSRSNQTGATCGRPSERTVASFAVRVPESRNEPYSSVVIGFMIGTSM